MGYDALEPALSGWNVVLLLWVLTLKCSANSLELCACLTQRIGSRLRQRVRRIAHVLELLHCRPAFLRAVKPIPWPCLIRFVDRFATQIFYPRFHSPAGNDKAYVVTIAWFGVASGCYVGNSLLHCFVIGIGHHEQDPLGGSVPVVVVLESPKFPGRLFLIHCLASCFPAGQGSIRM